jgi:arsenate reductase-like glutaredoxin family protein
LKNQLPDNLYRNTQKKKDAEKESHLAEERERKLMEYENMIRQIKEPTGFRTIQELVHKYRSQQATIAHLKELEKQYTAEIETLRHHKAQKMAEYEELKYAGETQHAQLDRMLQELHQHCGQSSQSAKDSQKMAEKSRVVLVNCKAGIQHIFDKLEAIQVVGVHSIEMTR